MFLHAVLFILEPHSCCRLIQRPLMHAVSGCVRLTVDAVYPMTVNITK